MTDRKRTDESFIQIRDMLSLAMCAGKMGAWSRDLASGETWWSPELEEILGLRRGDLAETELGWFALVHDEDLPEVMRAVQEAIETSSEYSVEFRFRHAGGEWRWMHARGRPLLGDDGKPKALHGIAMDVTERVRAKHGEAFASAIIDSSEDAILSKTLDGVITSWNNGATRMFGYTADEARGKKIDIIIPPDLIPEERQMLERLRRGERIEHYETIRRAKSGQLLHISLTISPVKDSLGRIIGASKIARDITDRRRIETERVESERRKDEFLAILGHELRNPLAPVRNAAHYLRLKGTTDPELKRPIEMIERQVARMVRLIDDLLDVSRISRGTFELRRERFPFSEVIEAALETCGQDIQSHGHDLRVNLPEKPIEVEGDRERLGQVFCNLITNAVKYTPRGGNIQIIAVEKDGVLEVTIKDDGIGIPSGKHLEIFELFTRLDGSLERQGGLGIGLMLVRQLVELHGGTIVARSDGVGLGSEFVVSLPIVVPATATAASSATKATTGPPGTRRRILVADDNLDAAESLALLLQVAGHEIHKAFDGETAIASAELLKPEVAILDIGMPKANGYEVARHIRAQLWGTQMYLVALTGWGQEADKRRAQEAGFDAHLVKPVALDDLNRLLSKIS